MKVDVPVTEVMTPHPRTVRLSDKISTVRNALAGGRIHHLPVLDGRKLVGMISTTDLLQFGFAPRETHAPVDDYVDQRITIGHLMRSPAVTIPGDSTVRDAARALSTGNLHAVLVVRGDDEVVGIVTSTDICSYVASQP